MSEDTESDRTLKRECLKLDVWQFYWGGKWTTILPLCFTQRHVEVWLDVKLKALKLKIKLPRMKRTELKPLNGGGNDILKDQHGNMFRRKPRTGAF